MILIDQTYKRIPNNPQVVSKMYYIVLNMKFQNYNTHASIFDTKIVYLFIIYDKEIYHFYPGNNPHI